MKKDRIGWVFWLSIRRRDWFSKLWYSRGANAADIQILNYHISIGLPWLRHVVDSLGEDHCRTANEANGKWKFSILI